MQKNACIQLKLLQKAVSAMVCRYNIESIRRHIQLSGQIFNFSLVQTHMPQYFLILEKNQLIIVIISNRMMSLSTSSAPRRRLLLMQQLISLLLVFRVYLRDIHTAVFYAVLCGFFVGKYIREGNTVGSVLQYVALLLVALSDLLDWGWLANVAALVAVLNYIFVAPCIYTLPEYKEKVGLRDHYTKRNNKQFYYAEWFPVVQDENCENYQIPWNHTVEMKKMTSFVGLKPPNRIFEFFISFMTKYNLNLAKGNPASYRGVILFSHGRSATPFMYTSILKYFATSWKILSPQHSEVMKTPFTDLPSIKKYRETQVNQRAEEIVQMASKVSEDEPIVLIGHSYGCPTVLQAYFKLEKSIRKRVTHIILLDPSLFPLTDQVFNAEIDCPVLMLSNQHWINISEIYKRNKIFIEMHGNKLIYFCWQGGDHLHQNDLLFILGTAGGMIKNAKLCKEYHQRNIQAMEMFLDFKKVEAEQIEAIRGKFGKHDLGINYLPKKWNNRFKF